MRFIHVVKTNFQILRANLDGSDVTTIVPNRKVTEITLDHKQQNIYWVDEEKGIIRTNYEGKNYMVVKKTEGNFKSLAFTENHLYYLITSNSKLHNTSTIRYCELIQETCAQNEKILVTLQNSSTIKFSKFSSETDSKYENPCKQNNGNCSDLCLLIPHNKKSCACRVGRQLNPDLLTCENVTEIMFYIENNQAKAKYLDINQKDVFMPTTLLEQSSDTRNLIADFEYDFKNDKFYFITESNIYRTSIIEDGSLKNIYKINNANYHIIDLSLDTLSNNLYFIIACQRV